MRATSDPVNACNGFSNLPKNYRHGGSFPGFFLVFSICNWSVQRIFKPVFNRLVLITQVVYKILSELQYPEVTVKMKKYKQINAARILLGLPERATMEEIKGNYRALIRKWHPDKCKTNNEKCKEMTTKIIGAYRIINDYCNNYKFSFSEKEVGNYLTAEEWWLKRFGGNSLWGDEKESK